MLRLQHFSIKRTISKSLMGFVLGATFGAFFGAVASIFQGGPELVAGVIESTPWFSAFGSIAGFLIAFERD